MKQKSKKKMLLSLAVVTTVSMIGNTQVQAFGESTGRRWNNILNSGLTATQDYQTWYNNEMESTGKRRDGFGKSSADTGER